MVFLFLLDAITSTALYITLKCGTWIAYGTANGVYYIYKKIKPSPPTYDENAGSIPLIRIDKIERDDEASNTNDDDCVILKRDEYEKLMLHVKIE
jgi:hypothetical protein